MKHLSGLVFFFIFAGTAAFAVDPATVLNMANFNKKALENLVANFEENERYLVQNLTVQIINIAHEQGVDRMDTKQLIALWSWANAYLIFDVLNKSPSDLGQAIFSSYHETPDSGDQNPEFFGAIETTASALNLGIREDPAHETNNSLSDATLSALATLTLLNDVERDQATKQLTTLYLLAYKTKKDFLDSHFKKYYQVALNSLNNPLYQNAQTLNSTLTPQDAVKIIGDISWNKEKWAENPYITSLKDILTFDIRTQRLKSARN